MKSNFTNKRVTHQCSNSLKVVKNNGHFDTVEVEQCITASKVPAEATLSKMGSFLGSLDREVSLEAGIYEPVKPPPFSKIRSSPFDQVVFSIRTVLVHGPPTCHHFKEDDPKAIYITF
ncbi:hypothetical protein IEQ34_017809 [Dendrobium chrysotoxum]|uniref:Uncharacterized protein n=1 Tax=Dendrobium chrysotoxum TaxID=161865 RepID=A0AAV7GCQ1_DENCH|nr:hypothetical protein IEQ34_017809 [Dendrobium chrysotoxum]